jgi:hypothetical protein
VDEPVIACSLSPEDYRRRLWAIRELGEAALLDVEARPDGALLSFRNSMGVRDQLVSIVRAEAACCSFLRLTLGSKGDHLTLAVAAPPEAMPVVRDLTASFQGTVSR